MRRGIAQSLACACLVIGIAVAPSGRAGETHLIDQTGQAVTPAQLDGHWLLVYFGFSHCTDVCPATLTRMVAVLQQLGAAGEPLVPLFVSLDPRRDTPEVLRRYAAHFSPRLRALTGTPEAVADAARTFGVPWHQRADGGIDHGLFLYLVGPDGTLRAQFHPQMSVGEMAGRVRDALAGPSP